MASDKLDVGTTTSKPVPKLKLRLVEETQGNSWPLSKWGVVGLSPQGSFMQYLRALYDENEMISIALYHSTLNPGSTSEDLFFDMRMFVNPSKNQHYEKKDVFGTFNVDSEKDSWYLTGGVKLNGTEFQYENTTMCLDSSTNDLFGVIDGELWCQRVRSVLCNSIQAKDCPSSKADLSKAQDITLTIEGKDIVFTPKEYIYFDSEGLQCRIGDPCLASSQGSCPLGTQVVLGKSFFAKYTPILNIENTTGAFSITLTSFFKVPQSKRVIWFTVGIIVATIAVFSIIYFIVKRKQASDEAHYVKV